MEAAVAQQEARSRNTVKNKKQKAQADARPRGVGGAWTESDAGGGRSSMGSGRGSTRRETHTPQCSAGKDGGRAKREMAELEKGSAEVVAGQPVHRRRAQRTRVWASLHLEWQRCLATAGLRGATPIPLSTAHAPPKSLLHTSFSSVCASAVDGHVRVRRAMARTGSKKCSFSASARPYQRCGHGPGKSV